MNSDQLIILDAERTMVALGAKEFNAWEWQFLNSIIDIAKRYRLTHKQRAMAVKILHAKKSAAS